MTLLGRRIGSDLELSVVAAGLVVLIAGGVGPASYNQDAARIDRLLLKEYAADAPGAAVFVSRGGTVVLK